MKLLSALSLAGITIVVSAALSSRSGSTPVARVVGLLQNLQAKLEKDLNEEAELYENYKCWHKSVTEQKTASNTAAESRVNELQTLITEIDAGKHEFTTERVDRENEIATLTSELETAEAQRNSEKKDYDAAKEEMTQAIAALDKAIAAIEDATNSSLMQTRSILDRRWSIEKALVLGRGMLSDADVKYLRRAMNGDVPKYDWKKLNRKADFKSKYEAKSGGIVKTLKSLLSTFTANLNEANDRETKAVNSYNDLKGKKETMKDEAEQALSALALENGARTMNKEEAQKEIDALNAQVTADKGFITDANSAFTTKEQEYTARTALRNKEITAISQAIAVLHSDDARDLFKKSFKSQGYSFLQASSQSPDAVHREHRAARIVSTLAAAAPQNGQLALLARLARNVTESAEIGKVVEMIDTMVAQLNTDEAKDLTDKETCEGDLSTAAAEAKKLANQVDESTEKIERDSEKVVSLKKQEKEQEGTITSADDQLKAMKTQREAETASYNADRLEDEQAATLVQTAHDTLKNWKDFLQTAQRSSRQLQKAGSRSSNFLQISAASFATEERSASWGFAASPAAVKSGGTPQKAVRRLAATEIHQGHLAKHRQPVETEVGKAPPPPPDTWTGAYAGATGESAGILSILVLVKADIEQDIAMAEKAETDAQTAYDKAKTDLEASKKDAQTALDGITGEIADYEGRVSSEEGTRTSTKGTLDSQTTEYFTTKSGCDFILVNYLVRVQKRQIEKDGLQKAKAILQGASFS